MPRDRRFVRTAPLALAAALALWGGPAAAKPVELTYKLWVGGLHGLTMQARVEEDGQRYDLSLRARTRGWTGTIFPFVLEARSIGRVDGARARPERFRTASREGSDAIRWAALDYPDGTGAPQVRAEPDPGEERDRALVPEHARRGTLDPVSAVYTLLRKASDGCEGTARIFDGRRRFDLTARDAGTERIRESSYALYSGEARVCDLTLRRVRGFEQDRGGGGKGGAGSGGSDSKYPDTVRVFLAEVAAGLPPLPVRLEAVTLIGSLRAHLVELDAGADAGIGERELLPLAEHTDADVPPIEDVR